MKYALGIDIGGTNIKALAVTPKGRILTEITVPTGDAKEHNWIGNVLAAREQIRKTFRAVPSWIGVAAPGLAAKNQRSIRYMPGRLAGLEGLNWQKAMRVHHAVPVLNDAHAALLGEVWLGAARQAKNALLLTLGTGVGGAALVDGRLLQGHLGRAGHFGHISLDSGGTQDIVRTPGSLEDAIGDCTVRARSGGHFDSTRALTNAARRADPEARRVWLTSVRALAASVASLINTLDPEIVVIGGGIGRAGPLLFRPLRKFLDQFEWRPGGFRIKVVRARLGERAGAFGAAWYAIHFQIPVL